MRQANLAQTSQRAASVRIALVLAVVAVALFAGVIISQGLVVHP